MTNEELSKKYIDNNASECPFCESTGISYCGDTEMEMDTAWRELNCEVCGCRWDEVFVLKGIDTENYKEENEEALKIFKTEG